MTRTRRKPDPVRPSATDPVDAWLDVLVAMLSIPKPDRQRVRDELEDHLRSRIDDLLIHGLTEPQALEKAVSELGETADLARQMSHAHRAPRTRRTVMHTALIAAAGGAIVFGASQLGSAPHVPAPHGAVAAAHAEEKQNEILIPVRDTTFGELMNIARDHSPKPLLVHWPMLEEIGITPDTPVGLDADPLPLHVVHQLLIEMTARQGNPIAMEESNELFEISTQDHFDRRTISRVVYDVAEISTARVSNPTNSKAAHLANAPRNAAEGQVYSILNTIVAHIDPEAWQSSGGSIAIGSIVEDAIVITAPERIQQQVGAMLAELHGKAVTKQNEIRQDAERQRAQAERDRNILAEQLGNAYTLAKQQYIQYLAEQQELRAALDELTTYLNSGEATRRESIQTQARALTVQDAALQIDIEEVQARMRYLRSRLIASDYETLLDGSPTSHQPPVALPPEAFRIEGAVNRPGDYQAPATGTMTLKRFIDAAGGASASISRIHIQRDGELFLTVEGEDLAEQGDITIRPGDRVTVLAKTPSPSKAGQN